MADNGSTITIGGTSKPLRDADSDWVTSQINGRSGNVCVVIRISTDDANLTFATAGCGPSGGGGGSTREYRPREKELIERWNAKNLGGPDFKLGPMVSFIGDLRRNL